MIAFFVLSFFVVVLFLVVNHVRIIIDERRKCFLGASPSCEYENKSRMVAIIGAGISGLAVASWCKKFGFNVFILEASSELGGVWARNSPKCYASLRCNVPREMMTMRDMPCMSSHASYPSPSEVCEYIETFAKTKDLLPFIKYNHSVVNILRKNDRCYDVVCKTDSGDIIISSDFVVVAIGQTCVPYIPDYPGANIFTGTAIHSSEYKNSLDFAAKTVLVIGSHSSGSDIVQDVSFVAHKTYLSIRHAMIAVLPRFMFGRSYCEVLFSKLTLHVPKLRQLLYLCVGFTSLFRTGLMWSKSHISSMNLFGAETSFPSHHLADCCDLLMRCSTGAISVQGQVESFSDHSVSFSNGKVINVDAVIWATGFTRSFDHQMYSFLPKETKNGQMGVKIFDYTFPPGMSDIAYALPQHPTGPHWPVIDIQAEYIARVFARYLVLPNKDFQEKNAIFLGPYQGKVDTHTGLELFRFSSRMGRRKPTLLELIISLLFRPFSVLEYLRCSDWSHGTTFEEALNLTRLHYAK